MSSEITLPLVTIAVTGAVGSLAGALIPAATTLSGLVSGVAFGVLFWSGTYLLEEVILKRPLDGFEIIGLGVGSLVGASVASWGLFALIGTSVSLLSVGLVGLTIALVVTASIALMILCANEKKSKPTAA